MAKPLNLFTGGSGSPGLIKARREKLILWSRDPMEFLHGTDVDGEPLIITQDEQDDAKAFKPFPTAEVMPHTALLCAELLRPVRVPTEAEVTLVDKSRRMMVSTQALLLGYWFVLFKKGRKVFLSKQTQELAEMLLMDKVRSTHLRTPQWFQDAMPFSMKPAAIARCEATGSEIICVSQEAAVRHFRGNAASILIVDEAAVQEQFGEMMQAANSMSQRIWALSSAYRGNPGADVWNALTEEPPVGEIEELLPNRMYDRAAMTARTTAKGYRVITLEAWAIPARDTAWLMRAEQRSASHADFQREVLRNKNVTSGTSVFPEFSKIGRERYIYEPKTLLAGPVIRGWDGGQRAPACTWMQYAPKTDRLYVLREFTPRAIASHHFRDVSMYLSGQLSKDQLEPECLEWVDALDGWPGIPKAPWFPPGTHFIDLSGPEYNATQSIAAKDPNEATQRQVWEARGIQLSIQSGPVKARVMVLRRLLSLRPDGYPGILIAPCCIDVLAMLDGGLTYKKQTVHNPAPEEIRKDGRFDNIFDSLTYPIVGIVPAVGVPGVTAPKEYLANQEESIGWSI